MALSNMLSHQKFARFDAELLKVRERTCKYWTEVLRRVVAVIKFLVERGLPFRGETQMHNSPNNGNYLGCSDLLAQFDPSLADHIRLHGNPGKERVCYLSSNVCDEFIDLMASELTKNI